MKLENFNSEHTFAICAYKESPYLEDCIKSLKQQSVTSHIIMVTSTPNDFIETLAKKYEIKLYINTKEKGIAKDWSFGLQCAITPYVTIAHQDDIYYKDYVKTFLEMVKRSNHPLIFFTNYNELRDDQLVTHNRLLGIKRFLLHPLKFKLFQKSVFIRRRVLSMGCSICCPSVTYIRPNITVPLFESKMKCSLDWDTWEVLSRLQGEFLYTSKVLISHRIHSESETSVILSENKRQQEDLAIFARFWPRWIASLILKFYSKSEKSNDLS